MHCPATSARGAASANEEQLTSTIRCCILSKLLPAGAERKLNSCWSHVDYTNWQAACSLSTTRLHVYNDTHDALKQELDREGMGSIFALLLMRRFDRVESISVKISCQCLEPQTAGVAALHFDFSGRLFQGALLKMGQNCPRACNFLSFAPGWNISPVAIMTFQIISQWSHWSICFTYI